MVKDHDPKVPGKLPKGNPPGTGRAGKGPGSSVNKNIGKGPSGRNPKNPTPRAGPGNKGGKPGKK